MYFRKDKPTVLQSVEVDSNFETLNFNKKFFNPLDVDLVADTDIVNSLIAVIPFSSSTDGTLSMTLRTSSYAYGAFFSSSDSTDSFDIVSSRGSVTLPTVTGFDFAHDDTLKTLSISVNRAFFAYVKKIDFLFEVTSAYRANFINDFDRTITIT